MNSNLGNVHVMLVIGRLIGQFTCHVIEYHLHELLFKFIFLPKMVQCNALRHEKAQTQYSDSASH